MTNNMLRHVPTGELVLATDPLPLARPALPPVDLTDEELSRAKGYIENSDAPATKKTYDQAFRTYTTWCNSNGMVPIVPDAPIEHAAQQAIKYLLHRDALGRKLTTIRLDLVAINHFRKNNHGLPPLSTVPQMVKFMRGLTIVRLQQHEKPRKAAAIMHDLSKRLIDLIGDHDLRAVRNRAIFLLAAWAGLRRSEICDMKLEHFVRSSNGARFLVWRSKTDQGAKGRDFFLHTVENPLYCPVVAIDRWLSQSGLDREPDKTTPLFRGLSKGLKPSKWALAGEDLRRMLRHYMQHLEAMLPAEVRAQYDFTRISPHSFRSGFITEAIIRKATNKQIGEYTGHKTPSVIEGYADKSQMDMSNPLRGSPLDPVGSKP